MKTGLVSITFRKLSPERIIELTAEAGLDGIEWGGDVHVPHGDIETANKVAELTRKNGLEILAYGSYYRAGEPPDDKNPEFVEVLNSAIALGTDNIRVWSGKNGSADATQEYREKVIEDLKKIGELAGRHKIKISLEFHGGTLTDTNESAINLMRELEGCNVFTYWQPLPSIPEDEHIDGLKGILPYLTNFHVYCWEVTDDSLIRLPLSGGIKKWQHYFGLAANTGKKHCAMLEFVKDNTEAQFLQDAATLKKLTQN